MNSLLTLIDDWAKIDEVDVDNKMEARHALEMRLVCLEGFLVGCIMAGNGSLEQARAYVVGTT